MEEKERIEKFVDGLNPSMKYSLTLVLDSLSTLDKTLDRALSLEAVEPPKPASSSVSKGSTFVK